LLNKSSCNSCTQTGWLPLVFSSTAWIRLIFFNGSGQLSINNRIDSNEESNNSDVFEIVNRVRKSKATRVSSSSDIIISNSDLDWDAKLRSEICKAIACFNKFNESSAVFLSLSEISIKIILLISDRISFDPVGEGEAHGDPLTKRELDALL